MPKFKDYGLEAGAPDCFDASALRRGIANYEQREIKEKKQLDELCRDAKKGEALAAIILKNNYVCKVYTQTEIKKYREATR